MTSTLQLTLEVKQANQDFEWYPTTDEIISAIKKRLKGAESILDVGAGDGRVLDSLTEGNKYAIEKSQPLLSAQGADIFVVGTEFYEQTLLDKPVDVVFSNPPYSDFEKWAEKIILEAHAYSIYLVLPTKWHQSVRIKEALSSRDAESNVILTTDFCNAERVARVEVDVIEVSLSYCDSDTINVDGFQLWFDRNFPFDKPERGEHKEPLKSKVENQLVNGSDLITTLEQLYQHELELLLSTYEAVSRLDASIFHELNVDKFALSAGLRLKTEGLKNKYWQELFENMYRITNRLTSKSRSTLFQILTAHTHVDFTRSNAFAVLEWVVKNANKYIDSQLISLYEKMVEKANVILYKSNHRTFEKEEWLYGRKPDELSRYKLDLRIVITMPPFLGQSKSCVDGKLDEHSEQFINDLCAVAYNLGFDTWGQERAASFEWVSGKKCMFHYIDHATDKPKVLFEAKSFRNGNLHLKLNQAFICKLNVEFGRLKGWLKCETQAAEELDISILDVENSFNSNLQIEPASVLRLTFDTAA